MELLTRVAKDLSDKARHRQRQTSGSSTAATSSATSSETSDSNETYKERILKRIRQEKGILLTQDLPGEISRYLCVQPAANEVGNPLRFWKNRGEDFPTLSSVARYYLTANASSVAVESMFSNSGLILNGRRSSLEPFKLNYICFIHDNQMFV